jgi:hypothetical protein
LIIISLRPAALAGISWFAVGFCLELAQLDRRMKAIYCTAQKNQGAFCDALEIAAEVPDSRHLPLI